MGAERSLQAGRSRIKEWDGGLYPAEEGLQADTTPWGRSGRCSKKMRSEFAEEGAQEAGLTLVVQSRCRSPNRTHCCTADCCTANPAVHPPPTAAHRILKANSNSLVSLKGGYDLRSEAMICSLSLYTALPMFCRTQMRPETRQIGKQTITTNSLADVLGRQRGGVQKAVS